MKKLARTLVLPLALCAITACDKAKSGGGGGGATGAAGASAIAPANGGLKRALAAMPKETDAVVGIDLSQVRNSGLYKKYEPLLKQKIGNKLDEFKAMCGFDPMEKITGILLGAKADDSKTFTFFIRGFDKAATLDCVKKASSDPKFGKVTVDGDYVEIISAEDNEPKRMLFVDDKTILAMVSGGVSADKAALQAAAAAKDGDGLTASEGFVKLLDNVKTGSTVWWVVNGNAAAVRQMGQGMFDFKAIFGSVNVSSAIEGNITMRMEANDKATTLVTIGNTQIDQMKGSPYAEYVKNVKMTANGKDAVITFKLDEGQFDKIVTQVTSLAGGGGF